jgi:hypothetical protein
VSCAGVAYDIFNLLGVPFATAAARCIIRCRPSPSQLGMNLEVQFV